MHECANMARGSNQISLKEWLVGIFVLLCISNGGVGILILSISLAVYFSSIIISRNGFKKELNLILNQHSETLALRYHQLIYTDHYGNKVFNDWDRECSYFIDSVILNNIKVYDYYISLSDSKRNSCISDIKNTITSFSKNYNFVAPVGVSELSVESMNGVEYEHYCASVLREMGWTVKVTQSTGDQGVDLIAKKGLIHLVVQCKRYKGSVGNSAVQQIIAGKKFYKANFAAVVTNSSYTKSAKKLAEASGVYLLHHTKLKTLDKTLK